LRSLAANAAEDGLAVEQIRTANELDAIGRDWSDESR